MERLIFHLWAFNLLGMIIWSSTVSRFQKEKRWTMGGILFSLVLLGRDDDVSACVCRVENKEGPVEGPRPVLLVVMVLMPKESFGEDGWVVFLSSGWDPTY